MKILVINGPNLNMLGIRQPEIYGKNTYEDLVNLIKNHRSEIEYEFYQSNHEGAIVDKIQEAYRKKDAIVINPGAYTHTSIAIKDALITVSIPYAEVHISDVDKREDYRKISYIRDGADITVKGLGFDGYLKAVDFLYERYGAK